MEFSLGHLLLSPLSIGMWLSTLMVETGRVDCGGIRRANRGLRTNGMKPRLSVVVGYWNSSPAVSGACFLLFDSVFYSDLGGSVSHYWQLCIIFSFLCYFLPRRVIPLVCLFDLRVDSSS